MAPQKEQRCLAFATEWYDPLPQLVKQHLLKFWPESKEAEMVDLKTRRLFLKRSPCPEGTSVKDFRIGNRILLYGRELTLVECADSATRAFLSAGSAQTVFVIGPEAHAASGAIISALQADGGQSALAKLRLFRFDFAEAADLANAFGLRGAAAQDAAGHYSSGPVIAGVLTGPDVVGRVADACKPLHERYGAGEVECGVRCAATSEEASLLGELLFGEKRRRATTATFDDSCTCCVIRPHAVRDGHVGTILDVILAQGYQVTALQMFHLDRATAEEFLEVYKGVIPHHKEAVEQLVTGPCVALELRAEDAVAAFRRTAGPWDVEMAKDLRPESLRARCGIDNVQSAVHCTDLPEDAESECRFFFELLQS